MGAKVEKRGGQTDRQTFILIGLILFFSKINADLANILIEVCGGNPDCVRPNVASPLWHKMKFELVFDKVKQQFVPIIDDNESFENVKPSTIKKASPNHIHIAVQKPHEDQFVINTKKPKFGEFLRTESLQKEGFSVITIPPWDWNKMSMSTESAKVEYVNKLLHENGIDPKPLTRKSIQNGFKY